MLYLGTFTYTHIRTTILFYKPICLCMFSAFRCMFLCGEFGGPERDNFIAEVSYCPLCLLLLSVWKGGLTLFVRQNRCL